MKLDLIDWNILFTSFLFMAFFHFVIYGVFFLLSRLFLHRWQSRLCERCSRCFSISQAMTESHLHSKVPVQVVLHLSSEGLTFLTRFSNVSKPRRESLQQTPFLTGHSFVLMGYSQKFQKKRSEIVCVWEKLMLLLHQVLTRVLTACTFRLQSCDLQTLQIMTGILSNLGNAKTHFVCVVFFFGLGFSSGPCGGGCSMFIMRRDLRDKFYRFIHKTKLVNKAFFFLICWSRTPILSQDDFITESPFWISIDQTGSSKSIKYVQCESLWYI